MPRTFHAFEDASGRGAGPNRAGRAVLPFSSVRVRLPMEVVPLHDAGEPLPLRDTDDVDVLARRELLDGDLRAHLVGRRVVRSDLDEVLRRRDSTFREMSLHRLRNAGLFDVAEAKLHGGVAVAILGSDLRDDTRTGLNDGHRNGTAFIGEDLGHAQLLAQDRFDVCHVYNLISI